MKTAFIFPGQGSQFVGMGKTLYDNFTVAKQVFDAVDQYLNFKLSEIIFYDPDNILVQTENTQPALMAVSMASLAVIQYETGKNIAELCDYVAGHSLGEYSALSAVNYFELEVVAGLLQKRGEAMRDAMSVGTGGMVAIIGTKLETIRKLVSEIEQLDIGHCQIANDNGAGQFVLSGHVTAMQYVVENYRKFGIKKAISLPVSSAFHSVLMQNASIIMRKELANARYNPNISLPIYSNVTANIIDDSSQISSLLVEQLTHAVRWREIIDDMYRRGVRNFIEIGAGKILGSLVKRTYKDARVIDTSDLMGIESFLADLCCYH